MATRTTLQKLVLATLVAAVTVGLNFAATFHSAAYNCEEGTVGSGSDLDKARHRVLDDLLDNTTPEQSSYCAASTVGEGYAYGCATCDASKVTHCDDCLSYAQDFLDDICEHSVGGEVVVGPVVCSMRFHAGPV
ncbi:unnamed protein product [Linum trigynum]|uniref:Gnk2-homologous domain-containing protein n=1 Tax=Linum trigynum TaxID=586398 RepID=A0AAV2F7E0_9ROSI